MTFDFERHPVRTCLVRRNFLYNYYDIYPSQARINHTALLLHGHGDTSYGWRNVVPGLREKNIRCIVPDMLGFGQSSKPYDVEFYKLKDMAGDMYEVLEATGVIGEKVLIIGHDWGSQLATRLALHFPKTFLACVCITGTYIPPAPKPMTLDAFTTLFPNFSYWHFFTSNACPVLLRNRMRVFWNTVIRKGGERQVPMDELQGRLEMDPFSAPKEWENRPALWDEKSCEYYLRAYWGGGWEAPMNWYKAFFLNFDDEKAFLNHPQISMPFLTVLGDDDPAVPVEAAEVSRHLLPNGKLVSMPCGHWIGQEDGPGLVRTVVGWLEDIEV